MPGTLPTPLTPLLGRARELEETARLLEGTRLLTITGSGGAGKTRLALELARREREKFDDVAWVELAPLTDPELIAQQMLTALGNREFPSQDVTQVVIDTVRDRAVLFVLDNCEHVVSAAAMVAEEVLRGCPEAKILATSRQPLGVFGEQSWRVPPLSEEDALQLFSERARAVLPSFAIEGGAGVPPASAGHPVRQQSASAETAAAGGRDAHPPANRATVAQICKRLDGIPLAIELAAARVKVLSVDEIARRLDDAFRLLSSGSPTVPRHRTIRETIDWSYRLLSGDEQALLRRLALFGGSFSLDAAEALSGDNVLEGLTALVDKSLVNFENGRYRLLDTVRQYASEKLEQSGELDALREQHARFFVALVEEAEPRVFAGANDPQTMARLDEQIDNIRTVFDWGGDPELELRLVTALHWYWFARGHFHEARRRINAALSRAKNVDADLRANAIVAAGHAAVWQGDFRALRPMVDEAAKRGARGASSLLGIAHAFAEGNHFEARRAFEDAVEEARQGPPIALALTLYWSGLAAQLRGDVKSARAAFEEALAIGESIGSPPAIAHPLTVLGHLALRERKLDEALRAFRRALDIHSQVDDRWGLTQVVEGIGLALLETGDAETGVRLLAAASAAWLHLGARPGRSDDFERERDDRIREAIGDQRLRVGLASGAAMPYEQMVELARDRVTESASAPVIRVRALGPLEIRRGETLLDVGSPRDLLLFLLCRPSGATKEQIGAALWPDADPAKLRNNFHVTVHRLRKSLGGAEWVVVDGETYALKPGIEFDVAGFERDARSKDAVRLQRAVELYRGDFFANATSGEWHLELRDRLRDLYARALSSLAKLTNDPEIWERLVAFDPLDEEAARNLMNSLGKRGDTAGAARVYRRLVETLRRELDTEPERETAELYKRLR